MIESTLNGLDPRSAEFVRRQVEHGRYRSADEVIQAALRLLEDQAKIETLRAALIEGESSGPSASFDLEAFVTRKRGD